MVYLEIYNIKVIYLIYIIYFIFFFCKYYNLGAINNYFHFSTYIS